jgi:hypothetical protein
MDELVERVRGALTAEYSGAPNGRVRDVPDRRAIRWYTTIGLVDKPLGMRGRTALYGRRHLQQLVAIKRRQAVGRSLAEIQVEFSWLTPQALGEVAQVPPGLLADDGGPAPDPAARHERFWSRLPSAADLPATDPPAAESPAAESPAAASAFAHTASAGGGPATRHQVSAVTLDGGVILLVPRPLADRDRDDIAAAATPLLALLAARGLTDGSSS